MKKKISLIVAALCFGGSAAWAATTSNPEKTVLKAAKAYIEENADLGGKATSADCTGVDNVNHSHKVEICTGEYHILGPGGGGNFKVNFHCSGSFAEKAGASGIYTFNKNSLSCEDDI